MAISLRDYQMTGIDDIINAWKESNNVLFQMPTGTGKTTLFCEIVRKFTTEFFPNKKVLIITHRKELVEQVFNRLESDFHLPTGNISSNLIGNQSSLIQVASIQTLVRRTEHQKDIFSLVIIDEAHHALASTYKVLWKFYPTSKFLGVTATPIRTNGEGFQDLFDVLITSNSIKWFIQKNYLSDIRYFASHTPDISSIKLKAGDYDETELSEVMQDKVVMADLVQSYIDFTLGKKIIVFAVNRAHCAKIAEKFNNSGFVAKSIDTFTTTEERNKIVNDFRNNKFKILCNVNIFTEGFDCPDVDAVQLARPTKSLTLFLQQVGRCMRPHQNKEYGIVLDNAGLWKEHGLPRMERNWSLRGAEKSICPEQKKIIGIREVISRGNSEPQESKSIRLAEIGELDNIVSTNTINYNNIEKNLIDKKILTMRERIEDLIKQIQKLEQRKIDETDEYFKEMYENRIKESKKELFELQEDLRPKRFEQVLELIKEKCQEQIDGNDIFVNGDKDLFLEVFVPPSLRSGFSISNGEKSIAITKEAFSKSFGSNQKKKFTRLKVTFFDGTVIDDSDAVDTFIKTLKKFGLDKVRELKTGSGAPLISDKDYNAGVKDRYSPIPDTSLYINAKKNTDGKKKILEKIAKELGFEITVEIVDK
jgi:superfamily II DNA or RNA helicase